MDRSDVLHIKVIRWWRIGSLRIAVPPVTELTRDRLITPGEYWSLSSVG